MSDAVTNRVKAHTVYKLANGQRVPGVTTILGVLNKPALVKWANNLGLQGIDSNKYVDEKAEMGTCAHYMIECHVKHAQPDLTEFSAAIQDKAANGFLKFLEWDNQFGPFELIASELELVSETLKVGGKVDLYGKLRDRFVLLDIKTSRSGIWPEMRHQVAAYRELLLENGHPVDETYILRVGRDEGEGFEFERVEQLDKHFEVFKACLAIYNLQKELK